MVIRDALLCLLCVQFYSKNERRGAHLLHLTYKSLLLRYVPDGRLHFHQFRHQSNPEPRDFVHVYFDRAETVFKTIFCTELAFNMYVNLFWSFFLSDWNWFDVSCQVLANILRDSSKGYHTVSVFRLQKRLPHRVWKMDYRKSKIVHKISELRWGNPLFWSFDDTLLAFSLSLFLKHKSLLAFSLSLYLSVCESASCFF